MSGQRNKERREVMSEQRNKERREVMSGQGNRQRQKRGDVRARKQTKTEEW